ncbi:MAG: hypothetical protein ABFS14_02850 [Gemmatimonadota bacterium]
MTLSTTPVTIQALRDTIPESPLPGGVTAVVRWLFHVPQWIQVGGGILAGLVAIMLAVFIWRGRIQILDRLLGLSSPARWSLAVTVVVIATLVAGAGKVSWDYMMHDNDFCTSCHVMTTAFDRFTSSKHAELNCHDCHQQSIFDSMHELNMWVLERPEEIGGHTVVPTARCTDCHDAASADSSFAQIAGTGGHRTHLESDSSALAEAMCVTCHGQEVHRFMPASETCGQSDCHASEDTEIVLGEMAGQTGLHCTVCHSFTAEVGRETARDTALASLVPSQSQCVSCHEMELLLTVFESDTDPHGATCGSCHDPHGQETPAQAEATCAAAGCHAGADTLSAFHVGIDSAALEGCLGCHDAHLWTAPGDNCSACHADILTAAPRLVSAAGLPEADFGHSEHADLECSDCHASEESHGFVFAGSPAACTACHHDPETVRSDCASCHQEEEMRARVAVTAILDLEVWSEQRGRELPFGHEEHADLACADCHDSGTPSVFNQCADCHAEHHEPSAACSACHTERPAEDAHDIEVHVSTCGGAGCHAEAGYGELEETTEFCLSCHQDEADHEPDDSCVRCHLSARGGLLEARPEQVGSR